MTKKWEPVCTQALDKMMDAMKNTIIADAEDFAHFQGKDTVDPSSLEIALYKAIATLNATNKTQIFQKYGPKQGLAIVSDIEKRAREDVSNILIRDLKQRYDDFPPEAQKIIDKISEALQKGGMKNLDAKTLDDIFRDSGLDFGDLDNLEGGGLF